MGKGVKRPYSLLETIIDVTEFFGAKPEKWLQIPNSSWEGGARVKFEADGNKIEVRLFPDKVGFFRVKKALDHNDSDKSDIDILFRDIWYVAYINVAGIGESVRFVNTKDQTLTINKKGNCILEI
ncbi:MAG: hypothetical protein PHE59_01980 [Patescibacteria group bacterium]|nr:hypothetical protein [Patescibacteria group bacterium]MDD5164607.1 hypothetical protein [Patescibacteria group bacterium]MDD5534551.1 hypothetical protein [Patescibacteria group bacterium]